MTPKDRTLAPYRSRGLLPVAEHDAVRMGNYVLVPERDADLPDRCIHCNAPADAYRKRHTLLVGPWWVPRFARRNVSVDLPLCPRHRRRNARGQLLMSASPAIALLSLLGLFFSVWLGAAGLLLALTAMMTGQVLKGFALWGNRNTQGVIRIRVGRAFLSSIPSYSEEATQSAGQTTTDWFVAPIPPPPARG